MANPSITLSIVSHGQGALVGALLADIQHLGTSEVEVVVTINVPEGEEFLTRVDPAVLTVIRNETPKGFGGNHNQAFARSSGELFCVVNPDIRLPDASFISLRKAFNEPQVGSCAPLVIGPEGEVQDSARRFPTLARLAQRVLLRRHRADYALHIPIEVDWTAGMFVMFRRDAFAQVGGFDERYFMYLEDADICRRLQRAGWRTLFQPSSMVVHDARRASHRSLRHLRWHLRSTMRFLTGF